MDKDTRIKVNISSFDLSGAIASQSLTGSGIQPHHEP